ncbi:ulp1 protease family, C-terminal catalytic domain-containing protein, partial [Tanacetum coccineum]
VEKEKAENRKMLMDLGTHIQLNRPQPVVDGYTRWMSHTDCAEPYTIHVDKEVSRQDDESCFAINARDIIELLTGQQLEYGIVTLYEMSLYYLMRRLPHYNKVVFLNPGLIEAETCPNEKGATIRCLTRALKGYEFYLAPYLQSRHYVLFIICPEHGRGFILDSSRDPSDKEESFRLVKLVEE